MSINQTADNHIFKFIKNKLAKDSTDFETQLYLCNEAFKVRLWNKENIAKINDLPLFYSGLTTTLTSA